MALGERQKREVPAPQRRLGIGNDGAQTRDAPARANQRGGGGMLPAFQLRHAKRHDVGIEERATAFQRREEAAIDGRERRLEFFGVGAARERQRLPSELPQIQLVPHRFQFGGALRDDETLQSRRESTQLPNRVHAGNVESAWILRYPIRSLNLARSCAGAGPSSPRFVRLLPAPVEAAGNPLSSGSPDPSHSPAAYRCSMPRSLRSRKSTPGAEFGDGRWRCASWTTAAVGISPSGSRNSSRTTRPS